MAGLALFISLGGTSYAVTKLPKNSVGSQQVKDGSLTAKDLKKDVLGSAAGPAGPRGPRGAEGASGAPGAPGVGRPPVVTRLPSSPADADEVYLEVDGNGEYGGPYLWHLRYDASLPSVRWRVLSGDMLWKASGAGFGQPNNLGWITTGAPRITPPTPGIYRWEGRISAQTAADRGAQFVGQIVSPSTPATGFGYSFVSAGAGYQRLWNILGPQNETQPAPAERTVSYALGEGDQGGGLIAVYLMATPVRLGS